MRRLLIIVLAGVVSAAVGGAPIALRLGAQQRATATNVPIIPHESVPNFFKLPPGVYLGENMGIATNSRGHIFIFHRSGDTRLYEFDQNGTFVKEIGRGNYGFSFAHSVRVDAQDNIWAVDEGTNMVIKFNPEGTKILLTIGRRPDPLQQLTNMPGGGGATYANKPYEFARPTDVAFDRQGNVFVSDGYDDARVAKYDKNGRFVKSAGTRGNGQGQLNLPHTIAADAAGNIYIGDRSNARVQVWDNDLNFKAVYNNVGSPWAVCVSGGPHEYLYVSNSWPDSAPAASVETTGEIYKMELDGKIVGKFGRAGKALGEFATTHQMDCRNPDVIFTAEINNWRSQKIILKPQATKPSGQ
jgi:DNA-binding beta-propeller fold protein YncE